MKNKFLGLILVLSSSAFAGDRVTSSWFTPTQVGADHNGPVFIIAPTGVADECPGNIIQSYKIVPDGANEDGYKSFTSIALTAQTAGKQVQVEYDNGPGCYAYRIIMR
ncbi:hypothetical protein [Vibrio sp. T11.5]|uniref:hypothetical protein n=1 Tax=Vibrio sp. T11.5 TaxID=2998836 RepID=UPI0022CD27ED|nr:hypothetical protein [Vibrio sp. T11.5]MDA0118638.1 hypothetical protein [Vibrio sp. T11.5]